MTMFQQGDQYLIEFTIKNNNVPITPDDVDDLRIQIHDVLKSYSKGEIFYNEGYWYYPLNQYDSARLNTIADIQVGIKVDSEIYYSNVIQAYVNASIIKKEW